MAEGIRLSLGRLRVAQSKNRQSKARTSLDIRIGIEDDWTTVPRGVLAALEPSWDRENAESFFSSGRISTETSSGRHISQVYIQNWAAALGARLTRAELEVMSRHIEGRSPGAIAEERGLSERTISNQLRTGCHKPGFSNRRELKGWAIAPANLFSPSRRGTK